MQKILDEHKDALKAKGSVQRIVCGGCLDFKIITTLPSDTFGAWEADNFAPEGKILEAMKAVDGVSSVETQTFTIADV